jgi:hypothetical protein
MPIERQVRSRAFVLGYALATKRMQGELARTKQAIADDVEALHIEMLRLATDLAAARAEVERLRALINAEASSPRLH